MPYIALGSTKASPGVTTLAFAAALSSPPERRPLVVEADPAGGSLAARLGLPYEPGLIELAAACRRQQPDLDSVLRFTQRWYTNIHLLLCPGSGEQATAGLASVSATAARALACSHDMTALVDLGRISGRSPSLELAKHAAVTVLVCRPRLEEIQHLQGAIELLQRAGTTTEVIVVGTRPHDPAEVAEVLGVDLFGVWLDDPGTAERFWRSPGPDRATARSRWWRVTTDLAEAFHQRLAEHDTTVTAGHPGRITAAGATSTTAVKADRAGSEPPVRSPSGAEVM